MDICGGRGSQDAGALHAFFICEIFISVTWLTQQYLLVVVCDTCMSWALYATVFSSIFLFVLPAHLVREFQPLVACDAGSRPIFSWNELRWAHPHRQNDQESVFSTDDFNFDKMHCFCLVWVANFTPRTPQPLTQKRSQRPRAPIHYLRLGYSRHINKKAFIILNK